MDHLSGLADIIARMAMWNIWYVAGGITIENFDKSQYRLEDWDAYQNAIASTSSPKAISPNRGDLRDFWQQDGIEIWSPSVSLEQQAEDSDDPNLASYVLCVRHGDAVVVLGGDADVPSWEAIYRDRVGQFPKVTVLKASHHGRKTGYHQPSVKAMSPDLTVASVGKKPANDASQLYAQYSEAVWSTRHHGNIVVTVNDDGTIAIESDRTRHDDLASRDAISLSVKMTISTLVAKAVAAAMTRGPH
jgi:beta-lactamase superfamily II metal-dependent hydrolase